MKMLVAALTLGTFVAAPAFAQSFSAYAAVTPSTAATARETAIRDCAVTSQRYTETTWNNVQSFQYRACMMQHGLVE